MCRTYGAWKTVPSLHTRTRTDTAVLPQWLKPNKLGAHVSELKLGPPKTKREHPLGDFADGGGDVPSGNPERVHQLVRLAGVRHVAHREHSIFRRRHAGLRQR